MHAPSNNGIHLIKTVHLTLVYYFWYINSIFTKHFRRQQLCNGCRSTLPAQDCEYCRIPFQSSKQVQFSFFNWLEWSNNTLPLYLSLSLCQNFLLSLAFLHSLQPPTHPRFRRRLISQRLSLLFSIRQPAHSCTAHSPRPAGRARRGMLEMVHQRHANAAVAIVSLAVDLPLAQCANRKPKSTGLRILAATVAGRLHSAKR